MNKLKFCRFGFVFMAIVLTAVFFFAACGSDDRDNYDVREWDDGTKVAVFKDDDGVEQLMEYAIFMQLMNNGGSMSSVRQYHRTEIVNSVEYREKTTRYKTIQTPPKYSTRQTAPKTSVTSTSKPSTPSTSKPTTPVRVSSPRVSSPPSRPSSGRR